MVTFFTGTLNPHGFRIQFSKYINMKRVTGWTRHHLHQRWYHTLLCQCKPTFHICQYFLPQISRYYWTIPRLHPEVGHWTSGIGKMDSHPHKIRYRILQSKIFTSGITNQCLSKYDSGRYTNGLDPFNIPLHDLILSLDRLGDVSTKDYHSCRWTKHSFGMTCFPNDGHQTTSSLPLNF